MSISTPLGSARGDHAGTRGRGTDDHRHAAAQHRQRRPAPARAGAFRGLIVASGDEPQAPEPAAEWQPVRRIGPRVHSGEVISASSALLLALIMFALEWFGKVGVPAAPALGNHRRGKRVERTDAGALADAGHDPVRARLRGAARQPAGPRHKDRDGCARGGARHAAGRVRGLPGPAVPAQPPTRWWMSSSAPFSACWPRSESRSEDSSPRARSGRAEIDVVQRSRKTRCGRIRPTRAVGWRRPREGSPRGGGLRLT